MTAKQLFEAEVFKIQRAKGWEREGAWQRAKVTQRGLYEAMVNEQQAQVTKLEALANEIQEREGISRDEAWQRGQERLGLVNVTSGGLPPGAAMTADGRLMDMKGRSDLAALGLATDAPELMIRIYRTAAQVKLTPEIAAVVVKAMSEQLQLARGASLKEAQDYLEKYRPEIWELARKAQPKVI